MKKFWIVLVMMVVMLSGCGSESLSDRVESMNYCSYEQIEGKAEYSSDEMVITVIFDGKTPDDDWWLVRRYVKQEDGRWKISQQQCVESYIKQAVEEYRTFDSSFD